MPLIGYSIMRHDSEVRMFRDDSDLPKCPKCGRRRDPFAHNPNFRLRRRRFHIYGTYDGQAVVSRALREFCLERRYGGLEFLAFDEDPEHYHLIVHNILPFDAQRRRTRFEGRCPECGEFHCVVGATPGFLKMHDVVGAGIWRSDLLFACDNEKSPIIIVSPSTMLEMKQAGLAGLVFRPVEGLESDQQ